MPECRLRVHLSHFLTLHMLTIRLTRLHATQSALVDLGPARDGSQPGPRRPSVRQASAPRPAATPRPLSRRGAGLASRLYSAGVAQPQRQPAPHRRPTRPREHADCASCPCAPHSPRHPPYPLRLGILHAHSSRHRLTMPCRPPDRSARAAAGCNPVDPSAAHYPTVSGGTCKRATATGCVWLVDTVVCSVNSGCLERLGSSRGATGRAYGADCCPVHGRRGSSFGPSETVETSVTGAG